MKLSIIIPAYNEEACLPATLDSIQTTSAQLGTGVDFEIIVVDNASDDETASVAREKGARLVHDPVRGISETPGPAAPMATCLYSSTLMCSRLQTCSQ